MGTMSLARIFRAARVRRTVAAAAVVLSIGGLVLFRTPAMGSSYLPLLTDTNTPTMVHFKGPAAHGSIGISQVKLLAGSERDLYAEVRLAADKENGEAVRAPLALAVVLDTSGSMYTDGKIDQARRAVLDLIRDMRDEDQIAVIRYSDSAEVIQPLARLGEVRHALTSRIEHLEAEGGTSIPSGLSAGLRTLEEATRGRVRRVVLVSDGLDSSRASAEAIARQSFGKGVTISALGIGLDFDESYMSSVAVAGHGHYGFVKDASTLTTFLGKELGEAAATTIEDATVRIHVPHGLHFVAASGADARMLDEDELELKLGALYAGDERRAVLHFTARLDVGDLADLTSDASWVRVAGGSDTKVEVAPLSLYGTGDATLAEASRDGAVFASWTSVSSSERSMQAAQAYKDGDTGRAQVLLDQNIAAISAATAAAPPAVAADLQRQQASYVETKRGFGAQPHSAAGQGAAKRAVELDTANLGRSGGF
ncbi:VWA domain-containing protein [soil metagenome]